MGCSMGVNSQLISASNGQKDIHVLQKYVIFGKKISLNYLYAMSTENLKQQMAETIRLYHGRGWSPATSTNYSFRLEDGQIWVSRSGVDKSQFTADDFMTVDHQGNASGAYASVRPSAETLIHCIIYELFPQTQVILHSHSVFPVLLSALQHKEVCFEGFEVQKGFDGQQTHDAQVSIPIFDNTQDMTEFADLMRQQQAALQHHCLIIRKHGTYAWGKNLFEAKRHLETLEYLCEASVRLKSLTGER